jgi:CBS domain containing-hemolysin-like protein
MEPAYGYRLLLMALIIGINGFFASAETALVSVRPSRLRQLAERGQVGAQAALSLLANPERLLSVVQVGVTLTSLGLGWVGEDTLYTLFVHWLEPVLTPAMNVVLHTAALVVAFVLMTFAHVVAGEVVPKNVAIGKADRLAVLAAPILLVFYKFVEPLVWTIERTAAFLSRALGVRSEHHGAGHSVEELRFIVSASSASGHLEKFERDALDRLLDLRTLAAREVMTPRNSLVMVDADSGIDEVLQVMSESRYSRLPVYEQDRENILGIVHVKDVLEFWTERRLSNLRRRAVEPFSLRRIVRQVPVVPETKPLHQLLEELRAAHAHVAFVVDEFGNIAGLVSIEDIFEQIVGEIEDEFDVHQRPQIAGTSLRLEGTTPIRDLATQYDIVLPAEAEFETLAGFLLYRLGKIPQPGESVEYEGLRFTVEEMDFNRIAEVRIDRLAPRAEPRR